MYKVVMRYKRAKQNRKRWFRGLTRFLRIFFIPRKYIFLDGTMPGEKCIVFSNHVAASAPVFHELYSPFKLRFWGTYEMTEDIKTNYRYLSTTYLHDKKKFPRWLSKIVGFIICPFVKVFYVGMKLIPTYTDIKLITSVKMTEASLNNGETVVVFPEDSHDGYHDHLSSYFPGGFFAADRYCDKYKCDLTIYNCYYVKKLRTFVVDKGIPFSTLKEEFGKDYGAMAKKFCDRANEIGETYRKLKRKAK